MYKRIKQKLTRRALNGEVVCFFYHRARILEEVKKRTSYLGSKRTTKEGALLLDQIAMTGDESDLFFSYFMDACGNVYDVVGGLLPENTSSFRVFRGAVVDTELPANITPSVMPNSWAAGSSNSWVQVNVGNIDMNKVKLVGDCIVTYETTYIPTGSTTTITANKDIRLRNVEVIAHNNGAGAYIAFAPILSPATDTSSAEQFSTITAVRFEECEAELLTPVSVEADTVVKCGDKYYQVDEYCSIGRLSDLGSATELPFDVSDGVLYRMGDRNEESADFTHIDTNALPAIDICIYNMITHYIMWQWLMVASPEDAATYKLMYDQQSDILSSRMSKFRGGWAEITARMW